MDSANILPLLTCAFLGAIMLLLPHISPRRYFFGITLPPDFRHSEKARRSLGRYHATVIAATVMGGAAMVAPSGRGTAGFVFLMVPLVGGFAAFLRERATLRSYAAPSGTSAEPVAGNHLPRWVLLAVVPFAAPLAAAAYLRAHWEEIPARFPIHWDLNGHANGWATKTVRGVYGPLIFGSGLSLLILAMALAMYYGSRHTAIRKPMLGILIGAIYLLAYTFTVVSLLPLVRLGPAAILIPGGIFTIAVLVWSCRAVQTSEGEETPDECWTLGSIYYNPRDPAIFVQKRIGMGYTVNFGNRTSWLLMGIFLAGTLGLIFLLPR
jgi:uncharacterized membrane protein